MSNIILKNYQIKSLIRAAIAEINYVDAYAILATKKSFPVSPENEDDYFSALNSSQSLIQHFSRLELIEKLLAKRYTLADEYKFTLQQYEVFEDSNASWRFSERIISLTTEDEYTIAYARELKSTMFLLNRWLGYKNMSIEQAVDFAVPQFYVENPLNA